MRMSIRNPSSIFSVEKVKDAIFGQTWLIIGKPKVFAL